MTIHTLDIHTLRTASVTRDRAILDLLHLQQLGLAPGTAPVRLLQRLWHCSQPHVSRRMGGIRDLDVYAVVSQYGRYRLVELQEQEHARQQQQRKQEERYAAIREQLLSGL